MMKIYQSLWVREDFSVKEDSRKDPAKCEQRFEERDKYLKEEHIDRGNN